MYYDIAQLYHLGKKRPRRDVQSSQRLRADIIVCLDPSGPSGGPCLCACVGGGHMQDPIPRLYNVQLEGMATLGMVLTGVEVIDGQVFHQAWHCRPLEDKVVIPWTSCPPSSLDLLI
ncbi:hypothetical protein RTH74_11705 [Pseudomonas sp. zfem001]|uniref:hypothetical protein n=1 Tax=Pseudomonas sp. zfem001 TaxID=3078196 RepID=UPI002928A218|nr:hypothetical protein [Pseudomonas sp. zfem001]MDU9408264.1 hypothetical protein [Pseudomonas sp. zfem001]